MSGDKDDNMFEENLRRILQASTPGARPDFERRLAARVRRTVEKQRRKERTIRRARSALIAAAAAAGILLACILMHEPKRRELPKAGEVKSVYGLVTLENGTQAALVAGTLEVRAGQWVKTAWGSKAQILLSDKSALEARQNTKVRIDREETGARVLLEQGSIEVKAAEQPEGKSLSIDTAAGRIRILGTTLDVIAVKKPDGTRQTRVGVTQGRVEAASAGKKVVVPAGTLAVIDEGMPPFLRSTVPEVNEIIDLWGHTLELAKRAGVPPGYPAIFEFGGDGTARLWLVAALANETAAPVTRCDLKARFILSSAAAYTMEGAPLESRSLGGRLEIDLSRSPLAPGEKTAVIVKVADVPGFLRSVEPGVFTFTGEADAEPVLRIVQFRLPETALLKRVSPAPSGDRTAPGRFVVTVSCDMEYPDIFE